MVKSRPVLSAALADAPLLWLLIMVCEGSELFSLAPCNGELVLDLILVA